MKKKLILILSILFVLYVIAVPTSEFLADLLAPVYVLTGAFFVGYQIKGKSNYKLSWIMCTFMFVSWGIADLLWFILSYGFMIDPESTYLVDIFYFGANLGLLLTAGCYFIESIKRWHRAKLILDIAVMFVIVLGIASGTFFSKIEQYNIATGDFIKIILYLVTDLLILLLGCVLIVSVELRMFPKYLVFAMLGGITYVVADLIYAFVLINDAYDPNSIVDILFYVSFLLILIAAAHEDVGIEKDRIVSPYDTPENLLGNKLVLWISIVPLLLFFMNIINITHFAFIIVSIVIYQFLSTFLSRGVVAEILLSKTSFDNETLEAIIEDRTKELRSANWELHNTLITDNLTGLKNRKFFVEKIEHEMEKEDAEFSILYMNLNRFKLINDVHGHAMGDEVLKNIADRFKHNACKICEYARIGGDEFGVIYRSIDNKELEALARKITTFVSEDIEIERFRFQLDISIGIARYPKDADNLDQLLRFANLALEHAKYHEINGNYIFYSNHLVERIERRNQIELLLKNADIANEFELYYQPKFELMENRLIGMEALVRWQQPELGFISPGEFIPIAEETGSILLLSEWVFNQATSQIKAWNETYNLNLRMSMNVSPVSMDSYEFIPYLQQLIQKHEVDPFWLEIEVTEHSAMSSATKMEEMFTAINNLGIAIAIDDFGTGYSSLNYLKRFDIDIIKIAKELIDNIDNSADELMIVKATIMMAQGMNLHTIAEGVERVEQLELLRNLGCDAIQGYLLGRPVTKDDFEKTHLMNK